MRHDHGWNLSCALPGGTQSSQRAEFVAIVLALRRDPRELQGAVLWRFWIDNGCQGDHGDLEAELAILGDPARVKTYYKPGDLECKQGVGTVEDAIVQRIGTRDVL